MINQTTLSLSVGWSESRGRKKIKELQEYFPYEIKGQKKLYNVQSLKTMKYVKELSDKGLSAKEISTLFHSYGLPKSDGDLTKMLDEMSSLYTGDEKILSTIPSSRELAIPLLKVMSDNDLYIASTLNNGVAEHFSLSKIQKDFAYPDSKETVFVSRMRHTRFTLQKQGYIEEVKKFTYRITGEGIELLNENIVEQEEELEELEQVVNHIQVIEEHLTEYDNELVIELLEKLTKVNWKHFENIVVELLVAMGYGAGKVTKSTNDEGLDGIIKEDKLGLENIYVQAKRWTKNVCRPDVMGFVGALEGKGSKGVMITTSSFSDGAKKYLQTIPYKKIILIDGQQLAKYMIEYSVGVTLKKKLIIKEVDFSYFEDE
ncbi:restriction endonuclease [Psychrobacillus sp. BL-248-WT-3]|uniref:restriction endonuclease n=1 Tax=Psychrobacillus sp. BL-248-WT-3 TaxID=2725306 RepID=UPI00146B82CF|nr:restriction endonuclease [Psychrobacillus sp. BL-248-WT-3]NME07238.1 restriction endonuclease [Psychrobacillus sp. BL-248-WT-3]